VINAQPIDRYMPTDTDSIQYEVWQLIMSKAFEYFILSMIGLNTLILMMKVGLGLYTGTASL